jgi:putative hydrolase of the HAD superfamily
MPSTFPGDEVSNSISSKFRAVTVDAHGVLLLPDPVAIRNVLSAFNCQPDDTTCASAHYRMVRLLDLTHDPEWAVMNRSYAEVLGVSALDQDTAGEMLASQVYLGTAWLPAPGAAEALAQLVASGYRVAVVSNTEHGEMAEVLERTKVCSVGGESTPVAAVIDSNVIGIAKPDPRPFELAFEALNESASTCIHVGDSLHSDVVGARGVGMEVVHVDPLALCAESDHRHTSSFATFVTELLA